MATFKGLNKAFKNHVEQLAAKAMQQKNSNTSQVVIEEGKRQVDSSVYDVYDPLVYERSGELRESWEVKNTEDGIAVQNMRVDEETGKYVAYTVETGQGYDYEFEYSNKPRPFTENTREALRESSELTNALKKDLKSIGLNVK